MLDFEADEELMAFYQSPDEYYIPIADESITNKANAYMKVYFPDVDKQGRNREIYKELSERLNEENIKNNISLKMSTSQHYMKDTEYFAFYSWYATPWYCKLFTQNESEAGRVEKGCLPVQWRMNLRHQLRLYRILF